MWDKNNRHRKEKAKIFSVLLTGEDILILLSYVYKIRKSHYQYHSKYKIWKKMICDITYIAWKTYNMISLYGYLWRHYLVFIAGSTYSGYSAYSAYSDSTWKFLSNGISYDYIFKNIYYLVFMTWWPFVHAGSTCHNLKFSLQLKVFWWKVSYYLEYWFLRYLKNKNSGGTMCLP